MGTNTILKDNPRSIFHKQNVHLQSKAKKVEIYNLSAICAILKISVAWA